MQIAIVGAGNVGRALALGWARAGHEVRLGVSDPGAERHRATRDAVAEVASGPAPQLLEVPEAAAKAEVVVLAVPWAAVEAVARTLAPAIAGKLVLDATNPLGMGPSGLELCLGYSTSGGERVAQWLPEAAVFKTLNQVGAAVMADTSGFPAPPVMFVAGDHDARKPVAFGLLRDLGFEARDGGPLRNARLLEPFAMVWIDQALNRGAAPTQAFAFMAQRGTQ